MTAFEPATPVTMLEPVSRGRVPPPARPQKPSSPRNAGSRCSGTGGSPRDAPSGNRRRSSRLRLMIIPDWSNRNFDLIFLARIAVSVGRALAAVVAPIYLALEGFSALELSEYVLLVAMFSAVMSSVVGLLSDRVGRRPFLVGLPLLTTAAAIAFAYTSSSPVLFAMGALGSFGRGSGAGAGAVGPYQPAESALVTDSLMARDRNAGFGRLAFGSSLGAMIGGLLAITVSSSHGHGVAATAHFRTAFLAIAATSALAGFIALGMTDSHRPIPAPADHPPSYAYDDIAQVSVRRVRFPRKSRWLLYRLWATNTVNGLAIGMFGPFVAYWFFRRFGAGPGKIGILFAVISAATMVSSLSAAGLARRWGLVRTVAVVRTAQAILLIPMVLAPTFAIAGAIYLVRMVVQRVGMPLRQSYAIGLADPGERASLAALSDVPSQVAMAGSPLVTGYMFEDVSLSLPFELAAALQMVNATMFWVFFRHHPPEEEQDGASDADTPSIGSLT